METRQITEYKIWILELAEMHGGVDKATPVAVFDSLEKLKYFYNSQLAPEPYTDGQWHKVFKRGSILEWFNSCDTLDELPYQQRAFGGVGSDWINFEPTNSSLRIPFNPTD